jgi:hypothetical protein
MVLVLLLHLLLAAQAECWRPAVLTHPNMMGQHQGVGTRRVTLGTPRGELLHQLFQLTVLHAG